jgi:hypothetical protein
MKYREIFFAHNGTGPYPCRFCAEEVSMEEVLVHHVDDDHTNGAPENLAAAHRICHTGHHKKGVPHTDQARKSNSEAKRRRFEDPAQRDRQRQIRLAVVAWKREEACV